MQGFFEVFPHCETQQPQQKQMVSKIQDVMPRHGGTNYLGGVCG